MSENMTESSVENNNKNFRQYVCYSANVDHELYEKYKAGERDSIDYYQLHDMKALSVLDNLGYPMDKMGTYLFKELILDIESKINLYDLNEPKEIIEDLESDESCIRRNVSVEFLGMSDNIYRRLISNAIAGIDNSRIDSELARNIYGINDENEKPEIIAYNIAQYLKSINRKPIIGRFTATTFDGHDILFRVLGDKRGRIENIKMDCPTLGISEIERMHIKPRFELTLSEGGYVYDAPAHRKGVRSKLIKSYDIDDELFLKLKKAGVIKYSGDMAYLYGLGTKGEDGEVIIDKDGFDKKKKTAFHRATPEKSLNLQLRGFF